MTGLAVGIDIGGTKVAAGLVAADGSVLARVRATTPGDADGISELAAGLAEGLLRDAQVGPVPVGVGAAGMIDLDGVVRYAPNIPWSDFPLRERLTSRLGVDVVVDNDANVAAWGEFRCGAGATARDGLVMLTVGTGVGGGYVQGGRLVRGAHGLGAEFGHIIVAEGGDACPCGNRGCLEAYASGTAIGRRARRRLADGDLPADSALRRLDELTGKTVTAAAHEGDAAARAVVADSGFWLGVGIASLVNALDPEVVVVGGGAIEAGELLLGPAREACAARVMGARYRPLPPVVRATLADDTGFVGAALLALDAVATPAVDTAG